MVYMFKHLTFIFMILSLMLGSTTMTGCDNTKSRAKMIVSLRAERKQMTDKLYQEYGGSDLSKSINANLQSGQGAGGTSENQVAQGLANLTQGVDRSMFEQTLRTVGRGDEQILVTEKAKQFFSSQNVIKRARKICEIELELEGLESRQNR